MDDKADEWVYVWKVTRPNGDIMLFEREDCANQISAYLQSWLPTRLTGTWTIRAGRMKRKAYEAIPISDDN